MLRWQAVPRDALMLHELDDELAVRNVLTGNTHLLDPVAAEVFRQLLDSSGGLTAAELAADTEAALVEELLYDLKRLGLAAPAV